MCTAWVWRSDWSVAWRFAPVDFCQLLFSLEEPEHLPWKATHRSVDWRSLVLELPASFFGLYLSGTVGNPLGRDLGWDILTGSWSLSRSSFSRRPSQWDDWWLPGASHCGFFPWTHSEERGLGSGLCLRVSRPTHKPKTLDFRLCYEGARMRHWVWVSLF